LAKKDVTWWTVLQGDFEPESTYSFTTKVGNTTYYLSNDNRTPLGLLAPTQSNGWFTSFYLTRNGSLTQILTPHQKYQVVLGSAISSLPQQNAVILIDTTSSNQWDTKIQQAIVSISIDYDIKNAKIKNEGSVTLVGEYVVNSSEVEQRLEFAIAEATSESYYFSNTGGIKVDVGVEGGVSIPFVADAKISVSTSMSFSLSSQVSKGVTKSWTATFPLVAPPKTAVHAEASVTQCSLSVDYTMHITYADGSTQNISGTFYGTDYYDIQMAVTNNTLPPSSKKPNVVPKRLSLVHLKKSSIRPRNDNKKPLVVPKSLPYVFQPKLENYPRPPKLSKL